MTVKLHTVGEDALMLVAFAFTIAITLPMSRAEVAPVSAMA